VKSTFCKHEHVRKGDERGVIVELKNRSTGRPFLMVWILNGPRKNQREYPERGWEPDEINERPDYDEDSITTTENKAMRVWRARANR
jgi:hypothetical protein